MIYWTTGKEIFQLDTPVDPVPYQVEAAEQLERLQAHKRLRAQVISLLDHQEAEIAKAMHEALARSRRPAVLTLAVGYDLETGEQVLASPVTMKEYRRRPLSDAERRIAEAMASKP